MNDPIDLLQIKIEKARNELSAETRQAIDAVPWKITILEMRTKKGYTFEQLGDLELETELLLCGLLGGKDYPKELEKRMKIPRAEVDVLINEMNELVFKKIREELVKNIEKRDKIPTPIPVKIKMDENEVLKRAGIEINKTLEIMPPEKKVEQREDILKKVENPNLIVPHPILAQKLSGSFQTPTVKTEYSLSNISKTLDSAGSKTAIDLKNNTLKVDPYREIPQ